MTHLAGRRLPSTASDTPKVLLLQCLLDGGAYVSTKVQEMIIDIDSIAIPLAVSVALVVTHIFLRSKISLVAATASLTFTLVLWGVITWLFRDGMGPDSIETTGVDAVVAFTTFFWMPALIWIVISWFCWRIWKRRANGETKRPE